MATRSELELNDIVLIVDLASNSGRSSPYAALGRIISFLDDAHSQAVVKYHSGQVDRPVGKMVRIVKVEEQLSETGQEICPLFQAKPGIMKKEVHFKMPQSNIQDKEMMLRSRKFTPKRKKHFKMIKRNIQDKEMMLRSKKFSGTFLLTPPPYGGYRGSVPGSRGP